MWKCLPLVLMSLPALAQQKILMKSISYEPKTLEIKVGEEVVWENVSLTDHSATGEGFDTGMINPKATSKPLTFSKAGTYRYHCSLHGRTMSGTLIVK